MSRDVLPGATDLRDFLRGHGWTLVQAGLRDRLFVMSSDIFRGRQLVFPIDAEAPDYADSVLSIAEKVSELLGVSTHDVLQRARSAKDDVLRVRVFHGGNDSVLPLSFAGGLISSAEKLLRSSASTVVRPRAHHPRLGFSEVSQLIERARFGQTEAGSFVIRVECPLNSMESQGSLTEDQDIPFVRQVTTTLQTALFHLTSAIESDELEEFVDNLKTDKSPIISSNFCEALVGMHDDGVDNSIDVGVQWAPLKPLPLPTGVPLGTIRVQRDYFARIEEVQRELRSVEAQTEDFFVGTVERLEGELGADGRRSGSVVLALLLQDEGEVRARAVLQADDYAIADHAHMTNGAYVAVRGKLRNTRQPRQLTDVTSFELVSTGTTSGRS